MFCFLIEDGYLLVQTSHRTVSDGRLQGSNPRPMETTVQSEYHTTIPPTALNFTLGLNLPTGRSLLSLPKGISECSVHVSTLSQPALHFEWWMYDYLGQTHVLELSLLLRLGYIVAFVADICSHSSLHILF